MGVSSLYNYIFYGIKIQKSEYDTIENGVDTVKLKKDNDYFVADSFFLREIPYTYPVDLNSHTIRSKNGFDEFLEKVKLDDTPRWWIITTSCAYI